MYGNCHVYLLSVLRLTLTVQLFKQVSSPTGLPYISSKCDQYLFKIKGGKSECVESVRAVRATLKCLRLSANVFIHSHHRGLLGW